jgi:hypothetical protein
MVLFHDIVEILGLTDLDGRLTLGVHGVQPGQIGSTFIDGYGFGRAILIDGLLEVPSPAIGTTLNEIWDIWQSKFSKPFHCSRNVSISMAGKRPLEPFQNSDDGPIQCSATDRHHLAVLGQ